MPVISFTFRPEKKIGREFVRVLQQMTVYARTLPQLSREKLPESIHEVRVLIKRFRALLWFANQTLSSVELMRAKSQLRKASLLLAPQRDLTVLQSTLKKLSRNLSKPEDRKMLARISFSHPVSFQQILDEKSLQQAAALLVGTIEQIKQSAKNCSKWPSPSKRLAKAFRTTKKAEKKALRSGKAIQFHDWRKKTKRLLYQLQLTPPPSDHHMSCIIKKIDKLQDVLGHYHDSAVAQDHLRKNPPGKMPQSLVNRSVKLLEKRKKRSQRKAQKLARRIKPKLAP